MKTYDANVRKITHEKLAKKRSKVKIRVSVKPDGENAWRVTKNRRPTRYRIEKHGEIFTVVCVDAMHPKEQKELFSLEFPHQQAAVNYVALTYLEQKLKL